MKPMFTTLYKRLCSVFSRLMSGTISAQKLARFLIVLTAAMLLPLMIIALYNYPADDDFGFVLPVATAWVQTGSLWEALRAIGQKVADTYQTWQGDFASTALFCITPMVFDIQLYFLDNWLMLALLCLSIGYLVKSAMQLLKADKAVFWIVYVPCLILALQFMPSIGYSIYWHNGGQYTTAACTLFLLTGLLLRTAQKQAHGRALFRGVSIAACAFMLGGSFYGPALGAFVLLAVWTVWAFATQARNRMQCAAALAIFAAAFVISLLAPGNALRQDRTGETVGALTAVITAVLDSFDLIGGWLSPQLLGAFLLIGPAVWNPLRDSEFSFRHPLAAFVGLYGLLAASLVPGIYTGFGYDTERYMNALYFYFLLFAIGSFIYAEGWLIRRLQHSGQNHLLEASKALGKRFSAGFLVLVIALTVLGGFEFTIMNTSSVSALKSLVTGEAAQFHEEMLERQEYIRVTDSDVVAVKPLKNQPYVFKEDRLPWQGIYGRVRYMKWYFELFHNAQNESLP